MTARTKLPQVDTAWLSTILSNDRGRIDRIEWHPVGTGQVADSYRGAIEWHDIEGPPSVVIKTPSADPTSRDAGITYDLYTREIEWYSVLDPLSDIRCPRCFGHQLDAGTGDFVLVLEDCAPAVQGDQLAGADEVVVRSGVAELAKLHGSFMNDERIRTNPLTARDPEMAKTRVGLYEQFWPMFRTRYAGRLSKELLTLGDALAARYEAFDYRETSTFTLAHCDFRLDNLLLPPGGGRPYVLDWQTMGEGSPMKDVAYFIGTSFADPEERSRCEAALLESYFNELRIIANDIDEDALRLEYRAQALAGFAMAVFSSMLVERTERGDEMFALMAERPGYQALTLDSIALI